MRAGEKRKFSNNMREFGGNIRIGLVGAKLFAPIFAVLAVFGIVAFTYHVSGGTSGILMAATPALFAPRGSFAEMLKESDDRFGPSIRDRSSRLANFEERLVDFMGLIANEKGMSKNLRRYMMEEAQTTSDFPLLFGAVMERTLLAKYSLLDSDWRTYTKVGTQNDFKAADILGVYGLEQPLLQVAERGEYKADTMGEGKISNTLAKFGRKFSMSWETIINDDMGAFADIAQRLATSAQLTEWIKATQLFVSSTGPKASFFGNSITHPIDGQTGIDNLTDALLTEPNFIAAYTALTTRRDKAGNPIVITRVHAVVLPAQQIPMLKLLSNAALITGANATQTSENVLAKLPITVHVNPYIPAVDTSVNVNKSWYLFGEGGVPAMQMNFLKGHETPEVVQKASDKVSVSGGAVGAMDGDFDSDTNEWRVRHVLGGTTIDPRMGYASDGSGS